jgi:hypothetical protein
MAKILKGNDRNQAVILPVRLFPFKIEAILASFGFDQFCPWLRWQAPNIFQYASHLPPSPEQNCFKPRQYF